MKKFKIFLALALMSLVGISGAATVAATDGNDNTFTVTEVSQDVAELKFGSNLMLFGNGIATSNNANLANGLFFAAGNQLDLGSKSEYAFVAGNVINYAAETEKDLFVTGNIVNILKDAKIGRDAFAAGNVVKVETSLNGDLSITANKVILSNIKIDGNLNIDAATVVIENKVDVTGKFVVNADAEIDGMNKISYGEIEKYENVEVDLTATDILVAKILSIAGLFIAFAIVMALFPAVKQRISKELDITQFGKDVLIGMMVLLFVPIIAVFLLITLIGAPAALLLLAVYVVMIYLAQGYSGLWLGKLIVEKLAHGKINDFLEMLIGITILALLVMIPWAGPYIGLLSLLLGLGLFMQSIKPNRSQKSSHSHTTIAEAKVVAEESSSTKTEKNTKKTDQKSDKE